MILLRQGIWRDRAPNLSLSFRVHGYSCPWLKRTGKNTRSPWWSCGTGSKLTAILTVSKKITPKLDGNIDLIKKKHGQTWRQYWPYQKILWANLTAILTVTKKIIPKLNGYIYHIKKNIGKLNCNIDCNKKNHTQT